jgi:hypothetical protein
MDTLFVVESFAFMNNYTAGPFYSLAACLKGTPLCCINFAVTFVVTANICT